MHESLTALMAYPLDLSGLWQQILQSASNCNDWTCWGEALSKQIGSAFQTDGCLVIAPMPAQGDYQISYWLASEQSGNRQVSEGIIAPLSNQLTTEQPIAIPDIHGKKYASNPILQTFLDAWRLITDDSRAASLGSLLCIVTEFQGEKNGIICLLKSQPYHWNKGEIEQLQGNYHTLAITLSQLQLQLQYDRKMQYQAVVNQLTLALQTTTDLNDFLNLATTGTGQALKAERAFLLRLKYWDPLFKSNHQEQLQKTKVTVTCAWSSITTLEEEQSFLLGECSLCQQALKQAPEPVVISHLIQSSTQHGVAWVKTDLDLTPSPALLIVPLENQGRVLGFLVFQHRQSYIWQTEDIELVRLVSAQVSTAMMQTETLRQVQTLVDKRTAELRESLSIQAKLYERMRHQVDQLRALNQLKDEFLSTISHELRTPLTSMTMAIRMLRQIEPSDPRCMRYLQILEQQCLQETNLINDLLTLQELETKQMTVCLQEIDLKVMLTGLISHFQEKWQQKGLELTINWPETPIQISSDRAGLDRVLQELLTNASKYADSNSQIHLTLPQSDLLANTVTISLCNIGAGITEEEMPHIFDKFRRGQSATPNAIPGTGLGLALVQRLVQLLKGQITATSQLMQDSSSYQTCFTLTLPQQWPMAES